MNQYPFSSWDHIYLYRSLQIFSSTLKNQFIIQYFGTFGILKINISANVYKYLKNNDILNFKPATSNCFGLTVYFVSRFHEIHTPRDTLKTYGLDDTETTNLKLATMVKTRRSKPVNISCQLNDKKFIFLNDWEVAVVRKNIRIHA